MTSKIGFGGGCHWCTEAVFQYLKGVTQVEQGFISPSDNDKTFSEAVIVHFETNTIPLSILIEIHLMTHSSTSSHEMRKKYRSAIYTFSNVQHIKARQILEGLQSNQEKKFITRVFDFGQFKTSAEQFLDYYKNNPKKPFCQKHIDPKLYLVSERFSEYFQDQKTIG